MTAPDRKTFIRVDDILTHAQSAHRDLKRHYERKPAAGGRRVELLLDYAARKEGELLSMIETYRREAPDHILDTAYQFTPEAAPELAELRAWQPRPAESLDDVLDTILEFDDLVRAFYRRAARMAPSRPVGDMFANLADALKEKERDQTLNAAGIRDL